MNDRINQIRRAEAESHIEAYNAYELFSSGSWLAKPVKTVLELLQLFDGYKDLRALDLGCGVGRNSIPIAQRYMNINCRVDCVDILEIAITKLKENAKKYAVESAICAIESSIDDYVIEANSYDLIMAISALEHINSKAAFIKKLIEIRDGLHDSGVVCLIVNTGVQENDAATGESLMPQFEVNLPTDELQKIMARIFSGFQTIKHTVVHQKYDIPRISNVSRLEADVVTYVLRKG